MRRCSGGKTLSMMMFNAASFRLSVLALFSPASGGFSSFCFCATRFVYSRIISALNISIKTSGLDIDFSNSW